MPLPPEKKFLHFWARVSGGVGFVIQSAPQRGFKKTYLLIIIHPDLHISPARIAAVFVGVAQGIDAAAIFLLIKMLALRDFDHTVGTALLAPVVIPIGEAFITRGGAAAAIVDLLHVLPPGDAEA